MGCTRILDRLRWPMTSTTLKGPVGTRKGVRRAATTRELLESIRTTPLAFDSNGLVGMGCSMMVNPSSSVWKNPDDSDEELVPPLADDDSSDDEMLEVTGAAENLIENEQHYDTDEELGFDDWYVSRARSKQG